MCRADRDVDSRNVPRTSSSIQDVSLSNTDLWQFRNGRTTVVNPFGSDIGSCTGVTITARISTALSVAVRVSPDRVACRACQIRRQP